MNYIFDSISDQFQSTLLKYFVGNRAQEAIKDSQVPLPVFIALPELGRSGKTFKSYYQIERILQALSIEDEQHRPSDWKRVAKMARWLQANYTHTPMLQAHYQTILQALERTLSHSMNTTRQISVNALGELGNSSTFTLLLQCLENHSEPAYDVAHQMLKALERLAKNQQMNVTKELLTESFSRIEQNYPALIEEIANTHIRIQNSIEDIHTLNQVGRGDSQPSGNH